MQVKHNGIGYIICSKRPYIKTLEELNEPARRFNNPSLMKHPDTMDFGTDMTEVIIGAYSRELKEHCGAKVTKDNKIYFVTQEEAEFALLYLEGQLVAGRLSMSK